jgi:hypothetical protein
MDKKIRCKYCNKLFSKNYIKKHDNTDCTKIFRYKDNYFVCFGNIEKFQQKTYIIKPEKQLDDNIIYAIISKSPKNYFHIRGELKLENIKGYISFYPKYNIIVSEPKLENILKTYLNLQNEDKIGLLSLSKNNYILEKIWDKDISKLTKKEVEKTKKVNKIYKDAEINISEININDILYFNNLLIKNPYDFNNFNSKSYNLKKGEEEWSEEQKNKLQLESFQQRYPENKNNSKVEIADIGDINNKALLHVKKGNGRSSVSNVSNQIALSCFYCKNKKEVIKKELNIDFEKIDKYIMVLIVKKLCKISELPIGSKFSIYQLNQYLRVNGKTLEIQLVKDITTK